MRSSAHYSAGIKGESAEQVLAQNGKSFDFAGKILDPDTLHACATLYHFCRYADDLVDEADNPQQAFTRLMAVRRDIVLGVSDDPITTSFLTLSKERNLDRAVTLELLEGLASDLGEVAFSDEQQLLRYCYRVAGTVGLHMCAIFDVSDSVALKHAIDLGIAMQLTNICRDVYEDAKNHRRYLPSSLVGDISTRDILHPTPKQREKLVMAVTSLLKKADTYYASAQTGLSYLPSRVRLAIAVAASVYREIGVELVHRDCNLWAGRVVVSKRRKYGLAMKAVIKQLSGTRRENHSASLHNLLKGMPHANA